jgi:hypothetical protein
MAAALVLLGRPEFAAGGQQASPAQTVEPAAGQHVVLTIGEEKMTAAQIDAFIAALPPQYQSFYGGPGKRYLPEYIIQMKVLSAEALKLKLEDTPEVTRALQIAREGILADAARKHFFRDITVSDEEMRDVYQKDKNLSQEVRIRHILIRTDTAVIKSTTPGQIALPEDEARQKLEDIRKRILAGADFGEMAKQYSQDAATSASGGDMGVVQRDKVIPPIVETANSLEPGQVSKLISTPYGLEIIQVESKRTKPFDEVKSVLEAEVRKSKQDDIVEQLVEKYHLDIDQDYFAGSTSKQPSPPAQ